MPLDGSPKKYAEDIARGLHSINESTLKRFTPPEIQKILVGLDMVSKELRQIIVDPADFKGLQDKGIRTQRVNGAMRAIRSFTKKNRFSIKR